MTKPQSFRTKPQTFGCLAALILLAGCGTVTAESPPRLSAAARLHVAAAAEAAGDTDIALAMYAGAAAQSPDDPHVQAQYANALTDVGQQRRASEVIDSALRRTSGSALLLRQSAKLELQAGHPDVALRRYMQALAITPNDTAAMTGHGVALDMLGRHDEAQAEYRRVLETIPDDIGAANDLALSLMFEGKFEAARQELQQVAEASSVPARARASLAFALAGTGHEDAARDLIGNALSAEQLAAISRLFPSSHPEP